MKPSNLHAPRFAALHLVGSRPDPQEHRAPHWPEGRAWRLGRADILALVLALTLAVAVVAALSIPS
ncbi:MAG TPA: hypothetical protein VFH92_01215 [Phenylobacterium sp.]|nr:hypothetical protein [Phenylobacterium sp.]